MNRAEEKMQTKETSSKLKEVEKEIDSDPYLSALYEAESGRNPLAKNPNSSAEGGFQFIKATAKAVGLEDPKDLAQSLIAVKKLRDADVQRFGDDPKKLYAAHFLGATLLNKVLKGAELNDREEEIVQELTTKALPRFQKIYERVNKNRVVRA
jgi:hypothetical protein